MRIKINIKKITTEDKIFNVEFPLYRKDDVSSDDYEAIYYIKVISENKSYIICKTDFYNTDVGNITYEFEIDISPQFNNDKNIDYTLGRQRYKCDANEFMTIADEMQTNIRQAMYEKE